MPVAYDGPMAENSSPSERTSHARLARGAAISSLAVMGSRVMGLVREQIFAFFFGASREYDAFLTAFRIPNLLRDLLAEGALSAAFVTIFVRDLQKDGKERAFEVANLVVTVLSIFLLGVVVLGMLNAETIVRAIAVGFDPEKVALATRLTQVMFPYIFLVAIAAVAMGMLNAQEYYAIPQSASTFFNIGSIAVGLVTAFLLAPDYMAGLWHHSGSVAGHAQAGRAMTGMAIGTLSGGLLQCLMQMPTLYRTGFRWRPRIDFKDPSFRAVLKLMGPAVVGAAAVQVNVFVNSNFASILGDKPISWLNYSFRLMQFPIGVFGVAVMTAALPAMSRCLSRGDYDDFGQTLTRSIELVLLLTLPSAAGLAVLGEPVMRLIYEHGRFSPTDTMATAAALAAYAIGLPGYAAVKILQPAYVAMGDAKTPMYTSIFAVAGNATLNYIFIKVLHKGHVGLAMSTSIMATFNVLVLMLILEKRRPTLRRGRLSLEVLKIVGATAAMAVVCKVVYGVLQQHGLDKGSFKALLELGVLLPVAVIIYAAVARVLKIEAFTQATDLIMRRLRPKKA